MQFLGLDVRQGEHEFRPKMVVFFHHNCHERLELTFQITDGTALPRNNLTVLTQGTYSFFESALCLFADAMSDILEAYDKRN
jgi:hypothetical protein